MGRPRFAKQDSGVVREVEYKPIAIRVYPRAIVEKAYEKHPYLTNRQLEAIGVVAVETTHLEVYLERLIWYVARLKPPIAKYFTHRLQCSARIQMLGDLAGFRIKNKKRRAELKNLLGKLKAAVEERNTIVHGEWQKETFTFAEWNAMGSKWPKRSPAIAKKQRISAEGPEFSATEIEKTAAKIQQLGQELRKFTREEWRSAVATIEFWD